MLRFASQGKTRERELPDTFLGSEFSPLIQRTYQDQVERMSKTQMSSKDVTQMLFFKAR